jgi:hypothetical protein
MKSPNFNLHIRKIYAWTSKKFTNMVIVLDDTIPSILISEGNVSFNHPRGQLVNENIYCILNSIPKIQ